MPAVLQNGYSEWTSEPSTVAALAIDFFQQLLAKGASWFRQTNFDFIPFLVAAKDDVGLCRAEYR